MIAGGADISPDQFDWYFYQGRAFGIHVDLNSGTLCSGKMLLGSYMKKPLWVDHSATTVSSPYEIDDDSLSLLALPWPSFTSRFFSFVHILQVFHLLTSSVNVVINGSGSRFHPAQAFQVPCGKKSKASRVQTIKPSVQLTALVCCCLFPQVMLTASRMSRHSLPSCTSPGCFQKAQTEDASLDVMGKKNAARLLTRCKYIVLKEISWSYVINYMF